jgi:MFS family permease
MSASGTHAAPRFALSRNLWLLSLTSLATDVSSHMVFPLVPLFLVGALGAGAAVVGLVDGAAETTAAWLKAVSGRWSDRIRRRKPFVSAGYALSALCKLGFVFATGWLLVLVARVVERFGKGIRAAPRDALIADEYPAQVRGRAFGAQRAMDGLGAVIGAAAAWGLLRVGWEFREIFLLSLAPGLLAVLFTLGLREPSHAPADAASAPRPRFRELPRALRQAVMGCALFAFGQVGVAFFLLAARGQGVGDADAIGYYVVFNLTNTLASWPGGRLSDRFGRHALMLCGYALFVGASALAAVAADAHGLVAAFAVYGVAMALVDATQRAWIADLAPARARATALGAYHAAVALVALPGGLLAGWLWQQVAPGATWGFAGACAIVALVVLLRLRRATTA